MRTPFSTEVEFDTLLPRHEVARRLREAVVSPYMPFFLRLDVDVAGRVYDDLCWLEYRTRSSNNGFQRRLSLNFETTSQGTRLAGHFAPRLSTLIFSILWCTGVLCFALVAISQVAFERSSGSLEMLVTPVVMLLFFAAIWLFGLWLSSFSEPDVLEFIKQLLASQETSGNAPASSGGIVIRPRPQVPRS